MARWCIQHHWPLFSIGYPRTREGDCASRDCCYCLFFRLGMSARSNDTSRWTVLDERWEWDGGCSTRAEYVLFVVFSRTVLGFVCCDFLLDFRLMDLLGYEFYSMKNGGRLDYYEQDSNRMMGNGSALLEKCAKLKKTVFLSFYIYYHGIG